MHEPHTVHATIDPVCGVDVPKNSTSKDVSLSTAFVSSCFSDGTSAVDSASSNNPSNCASGNGMKWTQGKKKLAAQAGAS